MILIAHELRLLLRSRMAALALLLVASLSSAAVVAGMAEISRQRDVIARIQPEQAQDIARIAEWIDRDKDAGSAAYYSFHATWDLSLIHI